MGNLILLHSFKGLLLKTLLCPKYLNTIWLTPAVLSRLISYHSPLVSNAAAHRNSILSSSHMELQKISCNSQLCVLPPCLRPCSSLRLECSLRPLAVKLIQLFEHCFFRGDPLPSTAVLNTHHTGWKSWPPPPDMSTPRRGEG